MFMKKLLSLLIIFLFTLIIDGSLGVAENDINNNPTISNLKRKIYIENLIKQIEFESEIKIPNYVDFKYIEYMYNLANQFNLPIRMVFRLVYKESSFIDDIVSSEGAQGFMQIMPKTYEVYAKKLNIDTLNLDVNCRNIYIGMNMLKEFNDFWIEKGNSDDYSLMLSLASYNAGMGKVLYYKGIPPYKETINYIEFILTKRLNLNYLIT